MLLLFSGTACATGISPMGGIDGLGFLYLVIQYLVLPLVVLFFLAKYLIPEFSRAKYKNQLDAVVHTNKRRAILSWLFPIFAILVSAIGGFFFYSKTVFSLPFYFSLIVYAFGLYYFARTLATFFSKKREGLYIHLLVALLIHGYFLYSYISLTIFVLTQFQ